MANPLDFEKTRGDSPSAAPTLAPGTRLGQFEITGTGMPGGMGVVYPALDHKVRARVAVKVMHPRLVESPELVERFREEAANGQRLRHDGIVGVRHLGDAEGQEYLVMDWVDGGTLRAALKGRADGPGRLGKLAWREAVALVQRMTEAVAFAHRQRVIHLDLKPGNILLDLDETTGQPDWTCPKLADFGLSRLLGRESLAQSAAAAGTAGYLAPERLDGAAPDARMDVFSVGVILYELVCGQMPGGVFKLPHALDPSVPETIDVIVSRCMAQAPGDRYQSAAGLSAALRDVERTDVDPSEMILIPAGEFWMGGAEDDAEAMNREKPRHQVFVDAFEIDEDPVTNARWKRFMEAGGYREQAYWSTEGWKWRAERKVTEPDSWKAENFNAPDQPVMGVSWYEAEAFCTWAGTRLPTEAEWEKAARGTDGRKYPWGNAWDPARANSDESKIEKTTPIGQYPKGASPYGVRDMAGNVVEWTADWYDEGYYKQSPKRNPKGPVTGERRVLRGGSWCNFPVNLRAASRSDGTPDNRGTDVGCRCARGGLLL